MHRIYNKDVSNILGDLDGLCGVYQILCNPTGKRYIGSTSMTFNRRLSHHISLLRSGSHKNSYLQRSWNKYGEESFSISVLEVCDKSSTLACEQIWLDKYRHENLLLNINPIASGTPNLSKEVIKKRAETMRRKYASGELVASFTGKTPWNKGLTKKDQDYSYLKVPKTFTSKLKEAHKNTSIRSRNKSKGVLAFSADGVLLGSWRSSKDLEEWSLTEDNNLPIKSRFFGERMGKPIKLLQSSNILKSAKSGKPYKGIYFKLFDK